MKKNTKLSRWLSTSGPVSLKKAILLTTIIIVAFAGTTSAQIDEGCLAGSYQDYLLALRPDPNTSCTRISSIFSSFFRKKESFIPTDGTTTPVSVKKKIKMRFVIHEQNASGTQHNYRSGLSDFNHLNAIINNANALLNSMPVPTYPVPFTGSHIQNAKLQFELTGIEIVNDSDDTYNNNTNLFLFTVSIPIQF